MSEQQFRAILEKLNRGRKGVLFFSRPLTDHVDLANGWITTKHPNDKTATFHGPNRYYLIRESRGDKYVGLVADANQFELHWYVLPAYRNKGYMYSALKNVILPHLFQDNRPLQEISIDSKGLSAKNYTASTLLAKKLGFLNSKQADKDCYVLLPDAYQSHEYFDGELAELDGLQAEELRSQMKHHFTQLQIIQSELEMKLGTTDEVMLVKEEIQNLRNSFDDLFIEGYFDKRIRVDQ